MIINQAGFKFAIFFVHPLLELWQLLSLNIISLVMLEIKWTTIADYHFPIGPISTRIPRPEQILM